MDNKIEKKVGEIIKFKDLREYEVLQVTNDGFVTYERSKNFLMPPVLFMSKDFIQECTRRGQILKDRSKEKMTDFKDQKNKNLKK